MVENKEEILSQLYCIKAGLSVISIEADKMSAMETEIQEATTACERNSQELTFAKNTLAEDRKIFAKNTGVEIWRYTKILLKVLVVLGGIVGAVVFGIMAFSGLKDGLDIKAMVEDQGKMADAMLSLIYIPLAMLCVIAIPVGLKILSKIRVNGSGYRATQSTQSARELRQRIKECEDVIPTLNERKANALAVYGKNKGACIALANDTYRFLVNNYTDYIHENDFQYVDLLIYYYETGRVDTLKEALNKVDDEVRFGILIKTIERESSRICDTIERSVSLLSYKLDSHFEKIGKQLDLQHRQTQTALDRISKGISESNARAQDLSNGQAVSNSLLQKINTNSTKLAEDASRMLRYVKDF